VITENGSPCACASHSIAGPTASTTAATARESGSPWALAMMSRTNCALLSETPASRWNRVSAAGISPADNAVEPRGIASRSTTSTSAPACLARSAAINPAAPPPATSTSHEMPNAMPADDRSPAITLLRPPLPLDLILTCLLLTTSICSRFNTGILDRPTRKSSLDAIDTSKTHRLYLLLKERITSGALPPGQRLPSEPSLATLHGLSRVTIRRALDGLSRDGLISRQPGSGTFVTRPGSPPPVVADLSNMLAQLVAMGRATRVKLLSFAYVTPPAAVATALQLEGNERTQHSLRVRYMD